MKFNLRFFDYAEELGLLLGADNACGLYTPAHRGPDGKMLPHQYALKMRFGRGFDPRSVVIGVLFVTKKNVSAKRAVNELALRVIPDLRRIIRIATRALTPP